MVTYIIARLLFFAGSPKECILVVWVPPSVEVLKFSVDGAIRRKPGSAGIRGVLCDSHGLVFSTFL